MGRAVDHNYTGPVKAQARFCVCLSAGTLTSRGHSHSQTNTHMLGRAHTHTNTKTLSDGMWLQSFVFLHLSGPLKHYKVLTVNYIISAFIGPACNIYDGSLADTE